MRLLLLDNYDSFTYNIAHLLMRHVAQVDVRRNDEVSIEEALTYDRIVLSPGPGLPSDAGVMPDLVRAAAGRIPLLGVCLGMQCIAESYGALLVNMKSVKHGVATELEIIEQEGGLFERIPSPTAVGHYHSWMVALESLPSELIPTALDSDGTLMAIRHREHDICGVQFHPESVLTPLGDVMIANWLGKSTESVPSFPVITDRINIAIDGHSACGKSTVSKMLADRLGYIYIDSGAMYRAVTLFALDNGLAEGRDVDAAGLVDRLEEINIRFDRNSAGDMRIMLNGRDVEDDIRTMRISHVVSPVSTIAEVREKLVEIQQALGRDKGVVMDGRDIGTVVFPDAELKIFLTASVDERSRRRWAELAARGNEMNLAEVMENVLERDLIDSTRAVSPLTKAAESVTIDNSTMTVEQTLSKITQLVEAETA